MDSRQRFVIIFATVALIPFTVFTFFNSNDMGIFVSSYAIVYFALRLILNPKMRWRVDLLGFALLALFAYYVSVRVLAILGA
ncbi:MAG: hypothetical protein ACRECH_13655 [Nitrososphaerales archaeon]